MGDLSEGAEMTREELKKLHVAVVSGGWSDEHEIAMESGKQCAAALKEAGFTSVDLLDVAEKRLCSYPCSGRL